MRILLVEDEKFLSEPLQHILEKDHYTVDVVDNGVDGLDYALSDIYDVILMDVMLPGMDGFTAVGEIRKEGIETPVLMLTAKGEIKDRVIGLDMGADDYLPKPFSTEELLARVRALSRRKGSIESHNETLTFGDLELFPRELKLKCKKREISLTLKECSMLEYLMRQKGGVLSKEQLIEKVWGYDTEAEDNNVEVYISFLRKKLKHLHSSCVITTIRGMGYVLEAE